MLLPEYKYKILCHENLSQIQMWLNQYHTNTGGNVELVCPITSFLKPDEGNKLYFMCTIGFKPWAGYKG